MTSQHTTKSPITQISEKWKRAIRGVVHTAAALVIGLAVAFGIIALIADHPFEAFRAFLGGSFQDLYGIGTMLSLATVLMLTGLASMVSFKAGAFNIGGEGQVYAGGLASAVTALYVPGPPAFVVPLSLVAGALMGVLWILIPALLRVYFGVTEIVTTLMSNYLAISVTAWLVTEYFKDPNSGARETHRIEQEYWLPRLFTQSNANIGLILALVIALLLTVYFARTRSGVSVQVIGLQPSVAESLGLPVHRQLLLALLSSGALAGLGGAVAVLGITHAFMDGFSPQFGFLGITVALIGRLHPIGVIFAALLYGALMTGATTMQSISDVPFALVFLLQGVLILLVTSRSISQKGRLS